MRKNLLACVLLLAIAAGALAFRLWRLDERVMHGDEANQAVRTGILMETGRYEYDLKDNHGPTLYYLSLPFAWLTAGKNFADTNEITFRLMPALFGAGLVLLLWLVRDGLGRWPMVVAALLTAISPAMTFYSRYYIQEMLLVFFTFGVIAAGWRYARSPSLGWALLVGVFAGLTYATKETWVLSFGAAAVALAVSPSARAGLLAVNRRHLLAALGVAAVVAVTFYSAFFTHWRGVLDSVLCYGNYLGWAGGEKSRHIHPWHFYLQMLVWFREGRGPIWSEALIVILAAVAMVAAWRRRKNADPESALLWFLAVYTLALTVIYSVIRHKSPWLAISFLHGMILLAGVGAVTLVEAIQHRWAKWLAGALLTAAAWQLGGQAWRANGRFCADPRNPCVYAHTSADLLNLVKRVEQIAAVHPARRDMVIEVCANPYDTWPMPWYFRKFPNVGYWTQAADVPADLRPAIIITSMDQEPAVAAKLGADWQTEFYGVRPMVLLNIRIQKSLWDKFMTYRRLLPELSLAYLKECCVEQLSANGTNLNIRFKPPGGGVWFYKLNDVVERHLSDAEGPPPLDLTIHVGDRLVLGGRHALLYLKALPDPFSGYGFALQEEMWGGVGPVWTNYAYMVLVGTNGVARGVGENGVAVVPATVQAVNRVLTESGLIAAPPTPKK